MPFSIAQQAILAGQNQIIYRRSFSDGDNSATGAQTFNITSKALTGAGGEAQPLYLQLTFEDGTTTAVVGRKENLKAVADVNFPGPGLFRARWEVAQPPSTFGLPLFRTIGLVNELIPSGRSKKFVSPLLPTDTDGNYLVRFSVESSNLGQAPVLNYFVRSTSLHPNLTLLSPLGGQISSPKTDFSWRPTESAFAYKLEIADYPHGPDRLIQDIAEGICTDVPESAKFGMFTTAAQTTTALSKPIGALIESVAYCWRVIALSEKGEQVAVSDWRLVRFANVDNNSKLAKATIKSTDKTSPSNVPAAEVDVLEPEPDEASEVVDTLTAALEEDSETSEDTLTISPVPDETLDSVDDAETEVQEAGSSEDEVLTLSPAIDEDGGQETNTLEFAVFESFVINPSPMLVDSESRLMFRLTEPAPENGLLFELRARSPSGEVVRLYRGRPGDGRRLSFYGLEITLVEGRQEGSLFVYTDHNIPSQIQFDLRFPIDHAGNNAFVQSRNITEDQVISATANVFGVSRTEVAYADALESLELSMNVVVPGETTQGQVVLDRPAPAGGVTVNLSSTSEYRYSSEYLTLPDTVFVPEGETRVEFQISTMTELSSYSIIRAQIGAGAKVWARLDIWPAENYSLFESLVVSPSTLTPNQDGLLTLTLSEPAPEAGISIRFDVEKDNQDATQLRTFTGGRYRSIDGNSFSVRAGESQLSFLVRSVDADLFGAHIVASFNLDYGANSLSAEALPISQKQEISTNVEVVAQSPMTLTLEPAFLLAGESAIGRVDIESPAPAGGMEVALQLDAEFVNVPTIVLVPAGETTAEFLFETAEEIAIRTEGILHARSNGLEAWAKFSILDPAGLELLKSMEVVPNPINVSEFGDITVKLTEPVGVPGLVLSFRALDVNGETVQWFSRSDDMTGQSLAKWLNGDEREVSVPFYVLDNIPSTVQFEVRFSIDRPQNVDFAQTRRLVADQTVTASAHVIGEPSAEIIFSRMFESLELEPNIVVPGESTIGRINLVLPAPSGGLEILLTNSKYNTDIILPSSIRIEEGETSVEFEISTNESLRDYGQIVARLGQVERTARLDITPSPGFNLIERVGFSGPIIVNQRNEMTVVLSEETPTGINLIIEVENLDGSPVDWDSGFFGQLPFEYSVSVLDGQSISLPKQIFARSEIPGQVKVTVIYDPLYNRYTAQHYLSLTARQEVSRVVRVYPEDFFPVVQTLTLQHDIVTAGESVAGTVLISKAAPTGGVRINLSQLPLANLSQQYPPRLSMPASIEIPEGKTIGVFTIETPVETYGSYSLRARSAVAVNNDEGAAHARLNIGFNILQDIIVTPTPLVLGNRFPVEVLLERPAPPGGIELNMSYNKFIDENDQFTVTIPEGQANGSRINLELIRSLLDRPSGSEIEPLRITAEYAGYTLERTIPVVLPPALEALSITQTPIFDGDPVIAVVTLNAPAPVGGTEIMLQASNGAAIPASIRIPAGEIQAEFEISTPRNSYSEYIVRAAGVASEVQATFRTQARPRMVLRMSQYSFSAGETVLSSLEILNRLQPESDAQINLSSDAEFLNFPSSVIIPAGETKVDFEVNTEQADWGQREATINASYENLSETQSLTVVGTPKISSLEIASEQLGFGGSTTATVTLSHPATLPGLEISVESEGPIDDIPSNVVRVRPGQSSVTFDIVSGYQQGTATIAVGVNDSELRGTFNISNLTSVSDISISLESILLDQESFVTVTLNSPLIGDKIFGVGIKNQWGAPVNFNFPASVSAGEGQTELQFSITATGAQTGNRLFIEIHDGGHIFRKAFAVSTMPRVHSVSFLPGSIRALEQATGMVTLVGPAPITGARVSLNADSDSIVIPEFVDLEPGEDSVSFQVQTLKNAIGEVEISAQTINTANAVTGSLEISAVEFALLMQHLQVSAGHETTGTVRIGSSIQQQRVVQLSTDNVQLIIPSTVTVEAGQIDAVFTVETEISEQPVETSTITATFGNRTEQAILEVLSTPLLNAIEMDSDAIETGAHVEGVISIDRPAGSGGLRVELFNDGPIQCPDFVIIPEGETEASFEVIALSVGSVSEAAAYIEASTAGYSVDIDLVIIDLTEFSQVSVYPNPIAVLEESVVTVNFKTPANSQFYMLVNFQKIISDHEQSAYVRLDGRVDDQFNIPVPQGESEVTFTVSADFDAEETALYMILELNGQRLRHNLLLPE